MILPENTQYRRGITRRLHNRRISMMITPSGEYQFHIKRFLPPGEADELRAAGHVDTVDNQIIRNKIWYTVVTLTGEALDTVHELREKLDALRQRKR